MPFLLAGTPPRPPPGTPVPAVCSLSLSLTLSISLQYLHLLHLLHFVHLHFLHLLFLPLVTSHTVCPETSANPYKTPQPSVSCLVAELSSASLMHQSLCSQSTESMARFDSKLDDVQNKTAALQAIEVSRKAMDAERDMKMDPFQADMAGLLLHQEANFAYRKSTFTTTSLPVMTPGAQPPSPIEHITTKGI